MPQILLRLWKKSGNIFFLLKDTKNNILINVALRMGGMQDGIHWQNYQVSQIRYKNMRKVLKKSIFDHSVNKAATYQLSYLVRHVAMVIQAP